MSDIKSFKEVADTLLIHLQDACDVYTVGITTKYIRDINPYEDSIYDYPYTKKPGWVCDLFVIHRLNNAHINLSDFLETKNITFIKKNTVRGNMLHVILNHVPKLSATTQGFMYNNCGLVEITNYKCTAALDDFKLLRMNKLLNNETLDTTTIYFTE